MARVVGAAFVLLLGHVASSARVRNVVEIREPKQEKIVPNPEDGERHKYIHDGKEYNRPPNLFDVGGGELKLLSEVLSNLNFETRDFKDDGTTAEQKELRDSRPWGRLYIDDWPAPIQYLRSHFGGPPADGMRRLVLADPLDGCKPLRNVDDARSAVVIATRGSCTYTTKARNAQEASASALLVVNNEQGLLHPPGPDGMDLAEIFSGMIPQPEGRALIEAMSGSSDPTQGALVPMNCNKKSGIGSSNQQCHAAAKADRDIIDGLTLGGFVRLPGGEKFEYLLAGFGVKVPLGELEMGAPLNPSGACAPMPKEAAIAAAGKAIVATRGTCSFIEKAEAMGAGPGERVGALIVKNSETTLFHMGAAPRWRGANISLPVVLVTDVAGHAISTLPPDSTIRFAPSEHVTLAAWDEIERLKEASAWPKETQERQTLYETLVVRNAGFPDRVSAIQGAFSRVCSWDEEEEGIAGQGGGDAERRETGDADTTSVKL
ncbi:unnamed protein product [Ectocarpus sp. 12 AP-2014]